MAERWDRVFRGVCVLMGKTRAEGRKIWIILGGSGHPRPVFPVPS